MILVRSVQCWFVSEAGKKNMDKIRRQRILNIGLLIKIVFTKVNVTIDIDMVFRDMKVLRSQTYLGASLTLSTLLSLHFPPV